MSGDFEIKKIKKSKSYEKKRSRRREKKACHLALHIPH